MDLEKERIRRALGGLLLRSGKPTAAIAELEKVPDAKGLRGETLYLLALAHHAKGDVENARRLMNEADAWTAQFLKRLPADSRDPWRPWLTLELLRREAHAVITETGEEVLADAP